MISSVRILTFSLVFFVSLLLLSLTPVSAASDPTSAEQRITEIVTRENLPSVQASFVHKGEHTWTGQFGEGTINTTYMIGSVQKVITAVAILKLQDLGLIDIDDDINNYMTWEIRNPFAPEAKITFRQLLGHRSGMANDVPYLFYWDTDGIAFPRYRITHNPSILEMGVEEYLRSLFERNGTNYYIDNWVTRPEKNHVYAPAAYTMLKYLIGSVTGESVEEFHKEYIFDPLGMDNTSFSSDNQATPYTLYYGAMEELTPYTGHYTVRSTSSDLTQLMIALQNNGKYGDYELLSRSSLQQMRQSYPDFDKSLAIPFFTTPDNFHLGRNGYHLGWIDYKGGMQGHGGSTPGFVTLFMMHQGIYGKNGVVITMNLNGIISYSSDWEQVWAIFEEMANILLEENGMLNDMKLMIAMIDTFANILFLLATLVVLFWIMFRTPRHTESRLELVSKYGWIVSLEFGVIVAIVGNNGTNTELQVFGMLLSVVALAVAFRANQLLRKHGRTEDGQTQSDTKKLVDSGLYARSRHPQYLSLLVYLISVIMIVQTVVVLLLVSFSAGFLVVHILQEEKSNSELIPNYAKYRDQVPIIPFTKFGKT